MKNFKDFIFEKFYDNFRVFLKVNEGRKRLIGFLHTERKEFIFTSSPEVIYLLDKLTVHKELLNIEQTLQTILEKEKKIFSFSKKAELKELRNNFDSSYRKIADYKLNSTEYIDVTELTEYLKENDYKFIPFGTAYYRSKDNKQLKDLREELRDEKTPISITDLLDINWIRHTFRLFDYTYDEVEKKLLKLEIVDIHIDNLFEEYHLENNYIKESFMTCKNNTKALISLLYTYLKSHRLDIPFMVGYLDDKPFFIKNNVLFFNLDYPNFEVKDLFK